ncbi:MAG: chlorophyllase [Phormidesmis sp.]
MLRNAFTRPLPVQVSRFECPAHIKCTSALVAGIALTIVHPNVAAASTLKLAPPYENFGSYTTANPVNGDVTDIYFPTLGDRSPANNLPAVLLLQGALVDKGFYSDYASQVARYGFAVAVPNHIQTVPGLGDVLASDTTQVQTVLDQFVAESNNPASPLSGKVDTQKFGLLGHSLGGAVGLSVIGEICLFGFCPAPFERPEALKGGAFFGANLRDQSDIFLPIANDGVGIALIQGEQDGRALPINAERTFEQIQTPPKALITLGGVNHFGITTVNTPEGAIPDPNPQLVPQETSIETIARWSGLFLRGTVLDDKDALDYVFNTGAEADPIVVSVEGERAEPIPEPVSLVGVAGGLLSLIYLKKRTG